jgi:lipopolysaccharide export system protein LptA
MRRAPCAGVALALAAVLAMPHAARAERADREKPINIESDRMTADDPKQTAVFEGRVILTQGTTQLRADKLTVRQDKAGNQWATAIGKPATFRTKRDNVDEWIDGEALRIEYDSGAELVELFERARLNRDKDVIRGNYISYHQRTEVMVVQDSKEGPSRSVAGQPNPGRVTAVFQPKPKAPAPGAPAGAAPGTESGPAIQLQPNQTLSTPQNPSAPR